MGGIFTSSCLRMRAAVRISLSLSSQIVWNWQNRTGNCNSRGKSLAEIFYMLYYISDLQCSSWSVMVMLSTRLG